jgi:hypothetical protein
MITMASTVPVPVEVFVSSALPIVLNAFDSPLLAARAMPLPALTKR